MHIFHLASDLGPTSTGRRLSYLVPKLKERGITQTIGVIGKEYPFGNVIRAAGIVPVQFRIRDAFDLSGLTRLRRFVSSLQPHIMHLWGSTAIGTAWILRKSVFQSDPISPYVVTSDVYRPNALPSQSNWHPRESFNTSHSWHEPPQQQISKAEARAKLGLSEQSRVIVTADRFDKVEPIRNAVWAVDLLKPTSPHYQLLVIGDGPARGKVERFARKLGSDDDRTRFLGIRDDVPDILAAADVVWNTRSQGGLHFAFEAMAAGLPIVASSQHPQCSSFLAHGHSDLLAAKDAFGFAQATQKIMCDDALRKSFGEWSAEMMKDCASSFAVNVDGLIKEYSRTDNR